MSQAMILAGAVFLCAAGVAFPQAGGQPAEKDKPAVARPADSAKPADPARMGASRAEKGGAAAPVDAKSFVIGAEDVLAIRVWREPELSGSYTVRPDGKISLPLVNEIQAGGLTPEQLAAAVAQSLTRYITRPEVSVAVQAVHSRKYYIQGEVQRPGAYPLVVETTVLEALVNAGGFRDFANTKKIKILRRGKHLFNFNYKDVTKGKRPEQNILLEPGDQIIVN